MPRRSDLGVAVLGCGHWGVNYVRLLRALGVARIIACDVDEQKLERLRDSYLGLESSREYREVVGRDDVDAVIVATTAGLHFEMARAALERGKDVLVEKPLTLCSADARELLSIARSRGRIVMVGHTFLYNPAIRLMRDYMTRGEIGSTYYLHATRTHLGLVRQDVNAVWDLATHDISVFAYLTGSQPESVSAMGGRFLSREREDVAFISLRYPGGVLANIFVSWVDSNKTRQIVVVGSRARIVFDDLDNLERLKVFEKGLSMDRPYGDFGQFQLLLRDGDIWSPRIDSVEPLRAMTEHFVDCVIEGNAPLTGGDSGLAVVETLEAIDRSIAQGGASVSVAGSKP